MRMRGAPQSWYCMVLHLEEALKAGEQRGSHAMVRAHAAQRQKWLQTQRMLLAVMVRQQANHTRPPVPVRQSAPRR
jgi:hypothetical protein